MQPLPDMAVADLAVVLNRVAENPDKLIPHLTDFLRDAMGVPATDDHAWAFFHASRGNWNKVPRQVAQELTDQFTKSLNDRGDPTEQGLADGTSASPSADGNSQLPSDDNGESCAERTKPR